MKRPMFLLLAALAALFAILVAVDVINFETDRIDRWVMIFGFAGVAFFVGLASADSSGPSTKEPTSQRAAAERALGANRPEAGALPALPGSLLRSQAAATAADAQQLTNATGGGPSSDDVEPSLDLVALEADAVDVELQEMIDEEQMEEITALVRQAEAIEDAAPEPSAATSAPAVVAEPEPTDGADDEGAADEGAAEIDSATIEVAPTSEVEPAAEPLARLELRLADYNDDELRKVVKDSESLVIAEMVRTGQLTDRGDLTERDIASMVFLAYTSEEMLAELRLRKSLDQPGEVALTDRALAPLKNIE